LNLLISGKLEGFTDKDLVAEMKKILREKYFKVPIGSTKPQFLLNKNAKEIVLAYKESDGTNTICSFIKTENNSMTSDSPKSADEAFENVLEKSKDEPISDLK
jgi:hypothetical protein